MNLTTASTLLLASTLAAGSAEALDLSFPGGTVQEYLAALQEADPQVRLVVQPDAGRFNMPAVEFRDVSPWSAIEAAARLHEVLDADYVPDQQDPANLDRALFVVTVDRETLDEQRRAAPAATFDLDFPGGSMNQFVEALREKADANIILQADAETVRVPAMTLRNANLHNVLTTISGELQTPSDAPGRFRIVWTQPGGVENLLYVVEIESEHDPAERRPQVEHWAIGGIVEETGVAAADVIGAIEVASEFFTDEVVVRYHEPTRVLIARGLESDLEVIDNLIRRVEHSAAYLDRAE